MLDAPVPQAGTCYWMLGLSTVAPGQWPGGQEDESDEGRISRKQLLIN